MLITRYQLVCNGSDCGAIYPPQGPVDGAIFTPSDMRLAARNIGWTRRQLSFGLGDFCPRCTAWIKGKGGPRK